MGIKNLLKELMPLSENVDLAKYRDRRVAIDGAGWLYRGCYACARQHNSSKACSTSTGRRIGSERRVREGTNCKRRRERFPRG